MRKWFIILLIGLCAASGAYAEEFAGCSPGNGVAAYDPILLIVRPMAFINTSYASVEFEFNVADVNTSGTYYIEWSANLTDWNVLAALTYTAPVSTPRFYQETFSYPFCDQANYNFRVRFVDLAGAATFSNIVENTGPFQDMIEPANPTDDIVSVYSDPAGTLTGHPVITWARTVSSDVKEYRIERWNGSKYDVVTTVPASQTKYIDIDKDGCTGSFGYALIAIDSCGRQSYGDYGNPNMRQTMLLQLNPPAACENTANLAWNTYYTMPSGLGGYRVYRQEGSAEPKVVKTITDTTSTSWQDEFAFKSNIPYSYVIEAYSTTGSYSRSCVRSFTLSDTGLPDSVSIVTASVEDDSYVKITYHTAPEGSVSKIYLERAEAVENPVFAVLDSLPHTEGEAVPAIGPFEDRTAKVDQASYLYRISIVPSVCLNKLITASDTARTMLLTCSESSGSKGLAWNDYKGWSAGVESYDVKSFKPRGTEDLITKIYPPDHSYPIMIPDGDENKTVCYRVVANSNSVANSALLSSSNSCCFNTNPATLVANAFRPESAISENRTFQPFRTDSDIADFAMTVYSRWGQKVFQTKESGIGWDGNVQPSLRPAPPGVYVYMITYTDAGGSSRTLRGTVALLR